MLSIAGKRKLAILSFIILNSLITASLGFTVTCVNDAGSSTATYNVDDNAAVSDNGLLGQGFNYRAVHVSGSGDNEYSLESSSGQASTKQSGVAINGQLESAMTAYSGNGVSQSSQKSRICGRKLYI